jgi:Holliday junction resolvase RusA-like endonuclease
MNKKLALYISRETPSKKNSRVINRLTGRSFPNKRFTEWHDAASLEIREQMVTGRITERIAIPCNISFIFIHGDNRRRDSDNQTSSILDLLIDCGILLDDDWKIVRRMTIENRYQKNNAGCLIEITALD